MSNDYREQRLAKQMQRAQLRYDHLEPPAVTTPTDMATEWAAGEILDDPALLVEATFETDAREPLRQLFEALTQTYGPEQRRQIKFALDRIAASYAPSLLDARATP